MALCFTHGTAGYLAYEAIRPAGAHQPRLLAAAVLLANAPDLDFVPGLLIGAPAAFHRGVTHTLFAVVVVGCLVGLARRMVGGAHAAAWRTALWASAVYASHIAVDLLTIDAAAPWGFRAFWPLSNAFVIAPVTPFAEIVINPSGRAAFVASLLAPHTIGVWAREIGTLLFAVAAVHLARLWPDGGALGGATEEP